MGGTSYGSDMAVIWRYEGSVKNAGAKSGNIEISEKILPEKHPVNRLRSAPVTLFHQITNTETHRHITRDQPAETTPPINLT
jgi:hypothetical protein